MASTFEITRSVVPFSVSVVCTIIFLIVLRKYLMLRELPDDKTTQFQKKYVSLWILFFFLTFILTFLYGINYYLAFSSSRSEFGSVISLIGLILSIAMTIPLFGIVGVILNKEKLVILPIIYTLVSTIAVFLAYEVHVGTDFEKGYEKPEIAQAFQVGAIVFILIFIIVMVLNYLRLKAAKPKKRALYYSVGAMFTLIGLVLVNIAHQAASSSLFTFSWLLFLFGSFGFYFGQNI